MISIILKIVLFVLIIIANFVLFWATDKLAEKIYNKLIAKKINKTSEK